MMNIDLYLRLEELISKCENMKEPIAIQPDEFCDLLNTGYADFYKQNNRVKFTNPEIEICDEGYYHILRYEGFKFSTVTTVPINFISPIPTHSEIFSRGE